MSAASPFNDQTSYNTKRKNLLQKELRSLGPQYNIESNVSRLTNWALPVNFAVSTELATVALIDTQTAAAFNGDRDILSRTEQLKAYLYQKQCPNALYYTFKIASESDLKTVASEIISHVNSSNLKSPTLNAEFVSLNQQVGLRNGCQSRSELIDSVTAGIMADYSTVTSSDLGNSSVKNEVFLLNVFELPITKWQEMEPSFQTPVYHAINTVFSADNLTQAATDEVLQEKTGLLLKTLSFLSRHEAQWTDLPTDIQASFNRVLTTLNNNNSTLLSSDELSSLLKSQLTIGVKWKNLPQDAQMTLWHSFDSLLVAAFAIPNGIQDNKVALSELIPLMTEMGIKWAEYLGSNVERNLSFLQTVLSTQSASINSSSNSISDEHDLKQQIAKAACGALTNIISTPENREVSIALLSRGENQLKALYLQTLHLLGNSGLKWEQIHSNHRAILLETLRDFHLLSYHDNTISFMNALVKLGVKWSEMHADFKLPITRALTSIGGVIIQRSNKITTHQLCDLLHACVALKLPWQEIPRTDNLKLRLMSTMPTMTSSQFHRFVSDLVVLEVSFVRDLGTPEGMFMTPFQTAIESATENCNIKELTDLMYNFTVLTFDDPALNELASSSSSAAAAATFETQVFEQSRNQALQCHQMFLSRFASLQEKGDSTFPSSASSSSVTIHPTMTEKSAIYFQYLSTSDILSLLKTRVDLTVPPLSAIVSNCTVNHDHDISAEITVIRTAVQSSEEEQGQINYNNSDDTQLFTHKEVNQSHRTYLINAFATLSPTDYTVSSQQSRLYCRALHTEFAVYYQRKPVAFIDTQVASYFNGKEYILSRVEQLKAYLYHKQCPDALYFPLRDCNEEDLSTIVKQVSEHVNTTVHQQQQQSTTTFTVTDIVPVPSIDKKADSNVVNGDRALTALQRSLEYFTRSVRALSVTTAVKTKAHIQSVLHDQNRVNRDYQNRTKKRISVGDSSFSSLSDEEFSRRTALSENDYYDSQQQQQQQNPRQKRRNAHDRTLKSVDGAVLKSVVVKKEEKVNDSSSDFITTGAVPDVDLPVRYTKSSKAHNRSGGSPKQQIQCRRTSSV